MLLFFIFDYIDARGTFNQAPFSNVYLHPLFFYPSDITINRILLNKTFFSLKIYPHLTPFPASSDIPRHGAIGLFPKFPV